MKLGILGGTFNPIHNGHLLIAEEVRSYFHLDKILFIPTKSPPHKEFTPQVSDNHRIDMVQRAIETNNHFSMSDIEINRGGVSYTIETIKALYDQQTIEDRIYLIIGGDLIQDITSWRNYEELIQLVNLVVVNRDEHLPKNYVDQFPYIFPLQTLNFSVTSTLIRERLSTGNSIKYLVPELVEEYILKHQLYK